MKKFLLMNAVILKRSLFVVITIVGGKGKRVRPRGADSSQKAADGVREVPPETPHGKDKR